MLFVSGIVGSRFPARVVLATGLCGIALVSFLKAHITSNSLLYTLLQVLHGIFQSAGWPTCVRLLSSWITTNRGFVTGIWTTCQSLGGILGALLATHFLRDGVHHGTWHTAYTIHVPIILFWALVVYMTITDAPPHASKDETVRMRQDEETGNRSKTHGKSKKGALPLKDVIAIPGVIALRCRLLLLEILAIRIASLASFLLPRWPGL